MEKSIQIMFFTESMFSAAIVTTVCPSAFVPEMKPTAPSISATNAPEIADPNFCDMVPEEKIIPIEDVPFFSLSSSVITPSSEPSSKLFQFACH